MAMIKVSDESVEHPEVHDEALWPEADVMKKACLLRVRSIFYIT